ncbi:Uncharacterised protein [Mycobacteroides abscessus subsp. abscessus]|nr:Uncharacterised protein [Mycobacteroides abscessus subsp. abscessus]
MIFMENMMIGLVSILTGIGTGMVLAKAILLAAENVLGLKKSLPFYMPVEALGLTAGAFVLLFAVISFFTVSMFRGLCKRGIGAGQHCCHHRDLFSLYTAQRVYHRPLKKESINPVQKDESASFL